MRAVAPRAPFGHIDDVEHRGRPGEAAAHPEEQTALTRSCGAGLDETGEPGELVTGLALDAPSTARTYRWEGKRPVSTDGPYAESKEQLAGFFVLDCATRDRAEELAAKFAGPGDVIELRPEMEF